MMKFDPLLVWLLLLWPPVSLGQLLEPAVMDATAIPAAAAAAAAAKTAASCTLLVEVETTVAVAVKSVCPR